MGSWNQQTGEASGAGQVAKDIAAWNPFHLQRYFDPAAFARAQQDPEVAKAAADMDALLKRRNATSVDLSDARLQQVALAARRRTGQGLSSTFVTGQGVGGQRPPSLLGG